MSMSRMLPHRPTLRVPRGAAGSWDSPPLTGVLFLGVSLPSTSRSARGGHSLASGLQDLYFTRPSVLECAAYCWRKDKRQLHSPAGWCEQHSRRTCGYCNAKGHCSGPGGWGHCVCFVAQCTYGCWFSTWMGDYPGNCTYLTPPHEHMRHLLPRLAHGYSRTRVTWDEPSCPT